MCILANPRTRTESSDVVLVQLSCVREGPMIISMPRPRPGGAILSSTGIVLLAYAVRTYVGASLVGRSAGLHSHHDSPRLIGNGGRIPASEPNRIHLWIPSEVATWQ